MAEAGKSRSAEVGELTRSQRELRALAAALIRAQDEERRRVARELHDDICQKLAVLEIEVSRIQSNGAAAELAGVRSAIATVTDDVRKLFHALHPSVIDDLGLTAGLRALAHDFQARFGMTVHFEARGAPEHVKRDVATGLYRIAQEALGNVVKHAGVLEARLILQGLAGRICLQVIDSGRGFVVSRDRAGLGLTVMEERARMMNGGFRVESRRGEGTTVSVDIPLG